MLRGDKVKINKIKKMTNGKYKIIFDNGDSIVTYDSIILKNNLLYNKEIALDLYNEVIKDNNYYDLYNKSISYISKKMRCKKEIINYLNKYTDNQDYINKIVLQLTDNNLLNEQSFTRAYISDRLYLSNDGINKIKSNLHSYDISDSIINDEISKVDDSEFDIKLEKLIDKKIQNDHNHSKYIMINKILNDMINNGFEKEKINNILEKKQFNSNIEKEFDKLYYKLKNNCVGFELKNSIKRKLYQKGYKMSEINDIITKKMDF